MDTFPFKYRLECDKTVSYATRTVVFESQKKQIQQISNNPIYTWKISLSGLYSEYKQLQNFFNAHKGNAMAFYFIDENGDQQIVRFADPKLNATIQRDILGTPVGYKASITLESVV